MKHLLSAVLAGTIAVSASVATVGTAAHISSRDNALTARTTAVAALERSTDTAEDAIGVVEEAISSARTVLDESAGRVLDETPRTALARLIGRGENRIHWEGFYAQMREARAATFVADEHLWPHEIEEATAAIEVDIADNEGLSGRLDSYLAELEPAVAAVDTAVAEWEAYQQFRRDYMAAARASGTRLDGPEGPRDYEVYVRTTARLGRDNYQRAVDAGGQVAITYPGYATVVSAHNYNDATALALRIGDTVTFTGAFTGTYRAVSYLHVPSGAPITVLNRLGAGVGLQTCQWHNGRTTIVGLVPVS